MFDFLGKAEFVLKRLPPWIFGDELMYPQLVVAMTVFGWSSLAEALESVGSTPKFVSHAPPLEPPLAPDPIRTLFGDS
jgi:hypothetical protein